MIFAVDVSYQEENAFVAAILFNTWDSAYYDVLYSKKVACIHDYESGFFYKRELPCILSILEDVQEPIDFIVIDGYVVLGDKEESGLGMHLWNQIDRKIPIIGVAKNYYKDTPVECHIRRGNSSKDLYITSIGVSLEDAKAYILKMHGSHRIPTLLKLVDQKSKQI